MSPSTLHTTHYECDCARNVHRDVNGVVKTSIRSNAICRPRHPRLSSESRDHGRGDNDVADEVVMIVSLCCRRERWGRAHSQS